MYLYYQYQTFCWITDHDNENSQNKTIQCQILEMEMLAKHMLHANIGNANSLISITKYDQRITRYGRSIYHKPTSFKKRRSSAGTYTESPHHQYLASTTPFTQGLWRLLLTVVCLVVSTHAAQSMMLLLSLVSVLSNVTGPICVLNWGRLIDAELLLMASGLLGKQRRSEPWPIPFIVSGPAMKPAKREE